MITSADRARRDKTGGWQYGEILLNTEEKRLSVKRLKYSGLVESIGIAEVQVKIGMEAVKYQDKGEE